LLANFPKIKSKTKKILYIQLTYWPFLLYQVEYLHRKSKPLFLKITQVELQHYRYPENDEWFCFSLDSVLLANFPKIKSKTKKILDLGTDKYYIHSFLTARISYHKLPILLDFVNCYIQLTYWPFLL